MKENEICVLLEVLSESEVSRFLSSLNQKSKQTNKQGVTYVKLLLKKENKEVIQKKLNINNNAFYALHKRVKDTLIDFIAVYELENQKKTIFKQRKLLITIQILIERKCFTIAYQLCKNLAKSNKGWDNFSIQLELCNLKIGLAEYIPEIDLNELKIEQEKLHKQYINQNKLSLGGAMFLREIQQKLANREDIEFDSLIQQIKTDLSISLKEILSYQSIVKLLQISNEYAHYQRNYTMIESFVEQYYTLTKNEPEQTEQSYYQIQVLYFMANLKFRVRKFQEAKKFLSQMSELLKTSNYQKAFEFNYAILYTLSEHFSGNSKTAIDYATELLTERKVEKRKGWHDLNMCLTLFLCQVEEWKSAYHRFKNLHHSDHWFEKLFGWEWLLKKNILEVIIQLEMGHYFLAESKIKSIRKRFVKILNDIGEERGVRFINLLERYAKDPALFSDQKNVVYYTTIIQELNATKEDLFVICFYGWITHKITNKPLYISTLDLI